jgi:hypothetical protein
MSNDRNSKFQTIFRPESFWSLNIGICDLFVIWCLEFVILDTKLQGKAIISLTPAIRDRHGIEDQIFKD